MVRDTVKAKGPVRRLRGRLQRILGRDAVLWRDADLCLYSYDATLTRGQPDLVALPGDTPQLVAAVKAAADLSIPVVARGAGTCLSGGPVPMQGGLVISLSHMDRILDLDIQARTARVQAGVVNAELQRIVAPHGLFFAPDPASQMASTIGGNVAENAGGPHCLKYGVTANHVSSAAVVLADGELVELGPSGIASDAYDLLGAILGSEGTLGIVAEITCRLTPQPQALATMLAAFGSVKEAIRAVSAIVAAGLLPATLEMMDRPLIESVQSAFDAGYPTSSEAVLIIEVDGLSVSMERQTREVECICRRHGALSFERAQSEADRQRLWRGRKGAMASLVNIMPNTVCTDVAVPRSALPDMLDAVVALGEARGMTIGSLFHAGDGNLHPQVLFDARDPKQVEAVHRVDAEIVEMAIERGGVLSGEHGIGCCKRPWMGLMFSSTDLEVQWAIKDAFDPGGRLNPGKVLPERTTGEPSPEGSCPAVAPADAAASPEHPLTPRSPEEAAAMLHDLVRAGQRAWVAGSGRLRPPTPDYRAVSTLGLDEVVLFDEENLTVTVQSGMRWNDLRDRLAASGQFVPLRPSCGTGGTVGGVIASDAYNPQEFLYGSCADVVLGGGLALSTGDLARTGSRCVKNVSGYAVHRLLVGSWGTLGLITDVTLRTRPMPEALQCMVFHTDAGDEALRASRLMADLVGAHMQPASMHLVSASAVDDPFASDGSPEGVLLLIGVEGLAEDVACMGGAIITASDAAGFAHRCTLTGEAFASMADRVAAVADGGCIASGTLGSVGGLYGQLRKRACRESVLALDVARSKLLVGSSGEATDLQQAVADQCVASRLWLRRRPPSFEPAALDGVTNQICRRIKTSLDPSCTLPSLT